MNKSQLKYNHFGSENLILPIFPSENENEHPGYKQQVLMEDLKKMKPLMDKAEEIMKNLPKNPISNTIQENVTTPLSNEDSDIEFNDWEMCGMETNVKDIKCNYDDELKEKIVEFNKKRIKILDEKNKGFHEITKKEREKMIIRYQNEQAFTAVKKINQEHKFSKQWGELWKKYNSNLIEFKNKFKKLEDKITQQNKTIKEKDEKINELQQSIDVLKKSLSHNNIIHMKLEEVMKLLPMSQHP